MPSWLSHPAVQSGIAPFLAAGIVATVLARAGRVAGVAALLAGFCATLGWVAGFAVTPLTSTRKIFVVALAAAPAAVALEWAPLPKRVRPALWAAAGALAVLWVGWPALTRHGLTEAVALAVPLALYGGWVSSMASRAIPSSLAAITMVAALGLTTGAAAILGASALLGQLALAIGSAAGGVLIVQLVRRGDDGNAAVGAAAALPLALLAAAATLYAKLPVVALLALGLVPLATVVPVPVHWSPWLRSGAWFALAALPGLGAILLTYRAAGPVPF